MGRTIETIENFREDIGRLLKDLVLYKIHGSDNMLPYVLMECLDTLNKSL